MRLLAIPLLVFVTGLTTAVTLTPTDSANAETVSIDVGSNWFCTSDFQTQPCVTNITAGDSVTWTIVQGVHTVTECDAGHVNCGNGFDSGILQNGDSFTHTFNTAGSVSYYCALHPDMTGVLNVQEPTPAPTAAPAGTTPPAGGTAAPTSTQSPGSVPQTGGPPMTESSTSLLWSLALVLGGLLVFGGGTAVVAARRR